MKKRLFLSTLSLLAAGIMFMNCKGDEGAVGPAGAKGDTGAQGTAGVAGSKGDAGTANVTYSAWLSFPAITTNTERVKSFTFSVPQITQDVIDKGVILAYGKPASGTNIQPLPYINYLSSGSGVIVGAVDNSITVEPQKLYFSRVFIGDKLDVPASFQTSASPFFDKIRYVIIPGGVAAGRKAAVDNSDYEAVKKYYNLPD